MAGPDTTHDRRAGGRARRGRSAARLDQRLDGAGARAHGHDGDGRAHARGDSHRGARSHPPGRDRTAVRAGWRRCPGREARSSSRWGARRGPTGGRRRGAGPSRRRPGRSCKRPPSADDGRTDRRGRRGRAGPRLRGSARARASGRPAAWPRRPAPHGDRSAPCARRSGQPVPLGLLDVRSTFDGPAALRSERGELCAYVYVDLLPGADLEGYVERRAPRRRCGGRFGRHPAAARASASSGPGSTSCCVAGQKRLHWIVPVVALRCWGCFSFSSGTSPRR